MERNRSNKIPTHISTRYEQDSKIGKREAHLRIKQDVWIPFGVEHDSQDAQLYNRTRNMDATNNRGTV